jgi:hypothetical protein
VQTSCNPTKKTEALLQLRARRQLNPSTSFQPDDGSVLPLGTGLQGVASVRAEVHPNLTLSTQLRMSQVPGTTPNQGTQTGWAAYQQATVKLGPLTATLRAYVYDAQAYQARLVFYEPGVLYQPKALTAYGQGTRLMALLQLKTRKGGDIYLKMAHTQPLQGAASQELVVQLRLWLYKRGAVADE